MSSYDKIMRAVEELAAKYPMDQISYSSIAKRADVHWTTVRRHVGGKEELQELLSRWQQQQGELHSDTRTRVMDAAIRVFAMHGYSGATLDQVALEAGQTKSVVYWHFTNKDDLYLAVCERNLKQQAAVLPRQIQEIVQSKDPVQALAAWLRRHMEEGILLPRRSLLFFDVYTLSREPDTREKIGRLFEEFNKTIIHLFQSLQEQGIIRKDMQAQSLAVYVQTILSGLVLPLLMEPRDRGIEEIAQDIAQLLWSSLTIA
ncbi:TetR/AcrR family transcriptional regulator [Paenibacillus sp. FSL K6-1096]|uniref:TetR/AcrR family transcriptional regulator n=1 Tax=Paenibacillus sp. FSL K6-1096 TaxID=2921460 RepID=UPI0030EDE013